MRQIDILLKHTDKGLRGQSSIFASLLNPIDENSSVIKYCNMKFGRYLLLASLFISIVSCSKDDEATPDDTVTMADFEGSWKATSSLLTNNANRSESFEMIANGGEIRFTAFADGRIRTWMTFGTFSDEWDSMGRISGDILTSTPAESTRPVNRFKFKIEGDKITLTNEDTDWDFTLSGADPISATAVTVFVPNK